MAREPQSPQTPIVGGAFAAQPIRVLVVDDSSLTRRVLTAALDSADGIKVVGTAASGPEALALVQELKPDVVTLDVEMPGMDGHEVLRQLMTRSPAPVIMVSYLTHEGAAPTVRALLDGAVDFVPKPGGPILGTVTTLRDELVRKVREAARSRPSAVRHGPLAAHTEQPVARRAEQQATPPVPLAHQRTSVAFDRVVVIGASTGGPQALQTVVRGLHPDGRTAYVIVQHMPGGMTGVLAGMLDSSSKLAIREAQATDRLAPDTVLLAPGDRHLRLGPGGSVELDQGPKVHFVRPSVDVTLLSAAEVYGSRTIVAMLTGMGSDGADGAEAIHRAGGKVIAQDEATCVVWGMPKAVVRRGIADQIVPLPQIASTIRQLLSQPVHGGRQTPV